MTNPENDSDTRLFRFDKKMFLELATKDEQDKRLAYGNVVTQIYIEEKDGAELKKLKDEKQVSDLSKILSIDDSQNREAIEKRKKEKEIERVKKEREINENAVVTSLTKYNKIFKNITMPKLNNYMMYLDKEISISIDDDNNIVVKYNKKFVKDKNNDIDDETDVLIDNIDGVNKNYIKTIKKKIYSDELKAIISKRSNFIGVNLSKIEAWKDDNNIISNNVIEELNLAKERLDVSTAEAKEAEAKEAKAKVKEAEAKEAEAKVEEAEAKATGAEVEVAETTDAKVVEAEADVKAADADVKTAEAAVETADDNLTKYIDEARKSPPPFDDKIKDVKDYLMAKDDFNNKDLIHYAGLNQKSYIAIENINTLDEHVKEFNQKFNIQIK
jgi:hypothetical protein